MTSTLMTRVTKDLVRTLGDMSPAPADSDFTDAWDRHIDTLRQCAIRLQRDFDMPDTADELTEGMLPLCEKLRPELYDL